MYGAGQYYIEDDDDVPPGFEGRRGRHGPQQAEHPPGNSSYVAPQYTHAPYAQQHSTSTAAHQQPSYSSNGYQQHQQPLYQQPAPPSANGHGYSNPNMGPSYQQQLGRMGSGEMAAAAMPRALGGARQFQRALSGSVAAAQQQPSRPSAPPQRPQSGPKSPRSAAAANPRFAAPDYGEYGNDSDGDYGATPNSMRHRNSSGKLHPHRGSSVSPGPGYHSSSSSPGRPMAGSSSSSYGRPAAPLPPAAAAAAVAAAAAAASSTAAPSPSASQQAAAAAGAGNSSNSAPGRPPVAASPEPEPDYGEYDVDEEYGQEARGGGRRRQTRQGGGGSSSSRPRSSSRSGRGPAPEMAVAAARQALAGIAPPPSGRTPRNARDHHRQHSSRQPRRRSPMSAERTAQLETELQALRSRLLEAEAREVEAHMAVINLSSDNSSLQAQLSGMRQQKQQLEQMLLFGSDQQDSEEGSQYTGSHSSYSGQSEGPIDGEDWGTAVLASDADAAQEQQLEPADDLQDGVSLPHDSVDALGVIEPDAAAQGAPAAAAGGDVESEIAEALAAAEAAASAAAAAGAAPAAAGGVPVLSALSLEEEIAQALAAAEAAGDAAVVAGSSAAAADSAS